MLMVFIFLYFFAGSLLDDLLAFKQTFIQNLRVETLTIDSVMRLFTETLAQMAFVIGPIMGIAFVGALAGNFLQFGFLFTLEPMKFDLKKWTRSKG